MMKFTLAIGLCATLAISSFGFPYEVTDTCSKEDELFPHHDCTKYYLCNNRELVERDCPESTYFNPREGFCDYKNNVPECEGGTRPPGNTTVAPPETTTARNTTAPPEETTTARNTTSPPEETTTARNTTAPPEETTTARNTTAPPEETTTARNTTSPPEETTTARNTTSPPEETTTARNTTSPPEETTTARNTTAPPTFSPNTTTLSPPPEPCQEDGVYMETDPENCARYYVCVEFMPVPLTCPNGTLFDPRACACNLAEDVVDCAYPTCTPDEVMLKPIPNECGSYLLCAEGKGTVGHCPGGLLFDPTIRQCNKAEDVKCLGRRHERCEPTLPAK